MLLESLYTHSDYMSLHDTVDINPLHPEDKVWSQCLPPHLGSSFHPASVA
jgi:hypothetical protein